MDQPDREQPRQLGPLLIVIAAVVLVIVALIGIAVLATSGDDDDPASVAAGEVATVDGAGSIVQPQFDHWYAIAARSSQISGDGTVIPLPKANSPRGKVVKDQTVEFLIGALWAEGEARERGLAVTRSEVQRAFAKSKRELPEGDYQEFLKRTGQSQADLRYRVRLEALKKKLSAATGKSDRSVVRDKWRPRTICAESYTVPSVCGND